MKNLPIIYTTLYYLFCVTILLADTKLSESQPMIMLDKDGHRIIKTFKADGNIHIDGYFNEKDWQNATFQGHFVQREPLEGEPATEETKVAILQNKSNLYIGIKCYDAEPEKIIAREMRRDSDLDSDDYFQIVIDTYHDHRNGFYFTTNPKLILMKSLNTTNGFKNILTICKFFTMIQHCLNPISCRVVL